jgi:DNA polymerase III sliding clamp (beta) subunit (PCNA family)
VYSELPILNNVLLKDGKAMATDMDTAVTVELPEVTEECLLPLKQVSQLLRYVNGNNTLRIEIGNKMVTLSWSEGKATLEAADVDDYPRIPSIAPVIRGSLLGDLLVPNLLSMLGYCAGGEDGRPVLQGVSLFLGQPLEIAAGDGYRMAFKTTLLSLPAEGEIKTVVIPAKAVATLGHLWSKAPHPPVTEGSIAEMVLSKGKIELEISHTLLATRFGVVSLLTHTVQGTPPSFKQLIPADPPHKVQFYAPDFEVSLKRLMSIAKEGIGAVRMIWEGSSMRLSVEDKGLSKAELTIPAQPLDGAGRIAINPKYLLEYVKGKSGVVTMGVTTLSGPVLFNYSNSPIVVIMPMNVSWPDDLPVTAPSPDSPKQEPPQETPADSVDSADGEEPSDEQAEEESAPVD